MLCASGVLAGKVVGNETPDREAFVQVLTELVPGQSPTTKPCSIVLLPVTYATQYVVLTLRVGQPVILTEFQPEVGVTVPVEAEQSSELGCPEELL